ncbi:MAG TPA: hypothetical protein VMG11_10655 [Steroidobacteraceae bacterium]|nr:hypothetical protein [Steroidobacteraceae bacterium]
MRRPELRLARPIYEGLPWLYLLLGVAALSASYRQHSASLSVVLGLPGLVCLLAGIVVLLRRRHYRRMRASYVRPDALSEPTREERSS